MLSSPMKSRLSSSDCPRRSKRKNYGSIHRGVRVGKRYSADGRKERFCKKCGIGLGYLSKERDAYAQK